MMPAAEAERNASISFAPGLLRQPLAIFVSESVRGEVQANRTALNAPRGHKPRLADQFDCAPPPP
ncbi:hypothetical protein OOJ09_04660 [Mesorhizobium qingshengii]|jgi:hypothetical protein|uniref:Uncharacterized protein n=1 Tax=Mesorhizobium qingshengii TaxID=1165689 RepID=A0ABT4QPH2_9HYPH|nr:hypothetical protein [Mesorhizobium qingshengii]MCZ8543457.1 hypothetical protein [Mesorhizobium qingshengii]